MLMGVIWPGDFNSWVAEELTLLNVYIIANHLVELSELQLTNGTCS
jgi:hypothetical protein